jgi:hypothetical protein
MQLDFGTYRTAIEIDTWPDGRMMIHVVDCGRQSMDVSVEVCRTYIERAWPDRYGFGIRAWAQRGITENQQAVIRRVLEIYHLIDPASGHNRETIKWLVDRDTALAMFEVLLRAE